VTSQTLAAGDPNCPSGGSAFTAANGTTYACNGDGSGKTISTANVYSYGHGAGVYLTGNSDATSVSLVQTGWYDVQFSRNILGCTALVTPGTTAAGGPLTDEAFATARADWSSSKSMSVYLQDESGASVDSSFYLTMIC
jgi:hypothetical protein